MTRRFNNLDSALKLLRPLSGGDAVDLADTTALGKWQNYRAGKVSVSYTRAATSNPEDLLNVQILPFALPSDSTQRAIVPLSLRAKNNLGDTGAAQADFNFADVTEAGVDFQGFVPAKATVRVATATATEKTSKLTGLKYKTKGGSSYTFPVGSKASNGRFSEVIKAISTKVVSATRSVSFTGEKFLL